MMQAEKEISDQTQGAGSHTGRALGAPRLFPAASSLLLAFALTTPLHGQGVPGQTTKISVPMVSEMWSKTALSQPAQPSASEEDEDGWQPFAFIQAKQQAEAKKISAPAASATAARSASPRAQSVTTIGPLKVFPGPPGGTPPDPMIAAGPNHLLVSVNSEIDIYDKTGSRLSTTSLADFFAVFNTVTCCFDPRLLYDQLHQRFILLAAQQLAGVGNSHILLAVSQTSDPTGAWNKYALDFSEGDSWPDFPGLGISDTAVYIANNQLSYDTSGASGPATAWITVIPIADLLAGSATLNITQFKNVTAANGAAAYFIEPAVTYGGSPTEFLIGDGGTTVHLFSINTVGAPALTSVEVPVPAYNFPPSATQPGSTVGIDTRSSVVLSPVWRNGSLWFTQNVASADRANAVLRWYELDTASATNRQVGTITFGGNAYFGALTVLPDGEVTLVFSTSGDGEFVSSGFAHRSASDPLNVMTFQSAYQQGYSTYTGFKRWGDLNGISLDPDGTTVWAISEYADEFSSSATEVAQLGGNSSIPPDFAISPTPAALSAHQGDSVNVDVALIRSNGFSESVNLSVSGLPPQATALFTPASPVTRSTLNITAGQGIAPGVYPLTITGTGAGLTHSSNVNLTVLSGSDFSIAATPDSISTPAGGTAVYNLAATALGGFAGTLNFSVTGLPPGANISFSPDSLSGAGTSLATITTAASTPAGKYPLVFTAKSGSLIHAVNALLIVTAAPVPPDFSLSASPQSATVHSGQAATYSLAISPVGGFAAPISFSCSGLPVNSACTFTPNPAQGSAATLQISTGTTLALATVPGSRIIFATLLAGFGGLGILFLVPQSRRRKYQNVKVITAIGGITIVLCLLQVGCGGGGASSASASGSSGSSTPPTTATTTAGTYTITVAGTSGSLQHSTTVQLIVQ